MQRFDVGKKDRLREDAPGDPIGEAKPDAIATSISLTLRAAWSVIGRCSIQLGFGAAAMGAVMLAVPQASAGAILLAIGAGSTAGTVGMWIDRRMRRSRS